jgi:mono/diheme cytochrome c family protein
MKTMIYLLLMILSPELWAGTPDALLKRYEVEAKQADAAFAGFSAERGHKLYVQKGTGSKGDTHCATCHTLDPKAKGRTRANREIEALAPSANARRFTDPAKVEKWFARNCDDVFARPCTPLEKGDFITWLLTIP